MAEVEDLPGAIRAAEAIAVDTARGQTRDVIVEQYGTAADQFRASNPYADDTKIRQYLVELARTHATQRQANLEAAEQVVEVALQATAAAADAAKALPTSAEQLERERRPGGISDTNRLLTVLIDETREARVLAEVARGDVLDVVRLYDAAEQRGDLGAVRVLEREILAGLPQISTRKGDPRKNAVAFDQLRKRVEAAQLARVPEDLKAAQKRLQDHRAKLRTWRLAVGPYANRIDIEALGKDWQALKRAREAG